MSRRTRRPAARKAGRHPHHRDRPAADHSPEPRRNHPRPNKWFLAVAVLLEAAWIGFLIVMVLPG
jgi:hypothetical protein